MHISKRHNNNISVKDKIDIADCFFKVKQQQMKRKYQMKFTENKKEVISSKRNRLGIKNEHSRYNTLKSLTESTILFIERKNFFLINA